MAAAFRRGKGVVMFGQGIGPLSDPIVLSWAKHVLPRVHRIGLRGTKGDKELLEAVGVDPSKMVTTGDDALELANLVPLADQRESIGINLRVAFYSGVQSKVIENVGLALQSFAKRYHATLVPVPIAFHECANDRESIRKLLAGIGVESDGGSTLDTPTQIMEQTARCRVVVTGAYHAAVFALGQGVPVVCLSNSSYYEAKFKGLEQLFGAGCTTITLSDPNLTEKLRDAIEEAWISADEFRLPLLDSAAQQIDKARKLYQSVKELFGPEALAKRGEVPARVARVL
jgi:colanic acid/amylovoran biosynthesis protein